jgi:hypothetical protein
MLSNMLSRLSPDVRAMLRPKQAFAEPPDEAGGPWLYWRRPLLLLLILCSGISLLTTGHFSLHVIGSTAIYWSLLPLIEIAGLAAVQRGWPEARAVDRFFMGHGPWLMFIIAFTAYGSSSAGAVQGPDVFTFWVVAAVAVLLWSCWIDYRFFASVGKLALHRAVSWTLFAAIFAGSWLGRVTLGGLGL